MDRFNNVSIRTQVLLVSSILLIIIVVMAAVVYREIARTEQRQQLVAQTVDVIGSTDAMLLQLVSMQSGFRGFLINGRNPFLQPYTSGYEAYSSYHRRLLMLVSDNPSQVERLKRIDQAVQDWNTNILQRGIRMREQVTAGQAPSNQIEGFITSGLDKALFDEVRQEISNFRIVESGLLQQRDQEAKRAASQLIATLFGSALVALLVGLGASVVISNNIARRVRLVAQAATEMAHGNMTARCEVAPSRDEVGRMSVAFNAMAATIQQRTGDLEAKNSALQQSNERQQQLFETIQQLSTPLLPVLKGLVVLPIVGHIDTRRADDIMRTLLHGVAEQKARVAILDVTGIATVDTHVIQLLLQAVQATELLGARVLMAGITAPMAQVIITQGIDLRHLRTYKDLRSAIESVLPPSIDNGSGFALARADEM
ncbi:MAG TPA: CHASE3 domain-containing protein [Herpetosiphonaceae bacterium]